MLLVVPGPERGHRADHAQGRLASDVAAAPVEQLGERRAERREDARGFLSGAVRPRADYDADDMRHMHPWWAPENFDENKRTADALADFAAEKGVSLAQLSIAWLLAQRPYVVPIPGSKNPERVAQNVAAVDVVLTADDLAEIARIAPTGAVGKQVWTAE